MNEFSSLREDDAPRALWERAVGWVVVAICVWIVLEILNPGMKLFPPWDLARGDLFLDTTTNGGDMGAHVWWPRFLIDNWFGDFRLSGWAPDWYAGFPAGHYYFPLPAVLVWILDSLPFVSYNVAFKLVTVSGPLLMPIGAYFFAAGLRAPWPAPPAFAIAATGMLVQTRDGWHIYGGNIASTLAGEFSFTLALALGLFALGALTRTIDTGRRPWLPALLLALAAMSHVVVAMVVGMFALLIFLTRRPWRTWPLAAAVGAVAVALTAVWSLPLIARHNMTQSMRYTKEVPKDLWELPGWIQAVLPGPVEHTIQGLVRGVVSASPTPGSESLAATTAHQLWLPWWMWLLGAIAVVAAGWYRRRSTLVLVLAAFILAVAFIQWPEHAVWNTRFLPFYLLTCGFIAAMGAVELVRLAAKGCGWAMRWINDGDLHDARAREWVELARPLAGAAYAGGPVAPNGSALDADACAVLRVRQDATADEVQRAYEVASASAAPERKPLLDAAYQTLQAQLRARATDDSARDASATDDSATGDSATGDSATDDSATDDSATDQATASVRTVDPELAREAWEVVALRQWDREPPNWEPPEHLRPEAINRRVKKVTALALAAFVALAGGYGVHRAWDARDDNPSIAIEGWARWNYGGYERKAAWPEYESIMQTMGELPCGRALWEPSSMEGDPINTYGTSLALELLPYFTDGCIGSMEGLYFESSATTSFHFLTVAEVAEHPSNPVRGLQYGTLAEDFDRGVKHMQQLGVRYYMTWTPEAQAKADAHPDLTLVTTIPDKDGADPKGWRVYEVAGWQLVEGLLYEPVVVKTHAGTRSECFDLEPPAPGADDPKLGEWECDAVNWWSNDDLLSIPWAGSGPDDWARVDYDDLADAPRKRLPAVEVTDIEETPHHVRFHVDEVGVPVVVKVSYFPNWQVSGGEGPYRLAPNLMVVIPTDNDVTLTYGLTPVDWLGRLGTLLGVAGLVVLVVWKGIRRYTAEPQAADTQTVDATGAGADAPGAEDDADDPSGPAPPDRPDHQEPAPALP